MDFLGNSVTAEFPTPIIYSGFLCYFRANGRLLFSNDHSLNSGKVAATPILKIRPIAIFAFYSLNYSLAARLQDNSCPKSPIKVETRRKLQQFTVSGWLTMNEGESGNEKKKTLRLKLHSV